MSDRPRLLILDAPGGPRPAQYLPSLLGEFDVHVVWLAVEPADKRQARQAAVRAALSAVAVSEPAELAEIAGRVADDLDVHGVLGMSERTVHVAQRLAGRRGLPANPADVIDALQNKLIQRERSHAAGVPGPAFRVLRTEDECRVAAREFGFPAVLKPMVGMGSLATFLVTCPDELEALWHRARELVDTDRRTAHLTPPLLLEEELRSRPAPQAHAIELGDYLSVDTLTVAGRSHVLAVSDKLPLSPPFRENGHLLPTVRIGRELREVVDCALAAQRGLGVTFGVCHTEVKLTPDGPRVVEVNGRPGGSVPELLRLIADYDLALQLARLTCGLPVDTELRVRRHGACLTPQPPTGRHLVVRAPSAETVHQVPGVVTIYNLARSGGLVDSDVGSASNLFRLTAVAKSRGDLIKLRERLLAPDFFRLTQADHRSA